MNCKNDSGQKVGGNKGYTLVEVVVGFTIFTIMFTSILGTALTINLMIRKSSLIKAANTVSNNKIEFFRTLPFDDIKNDVLPVSPIEEEVVISGNTFYLTTEVKSLDFTGITDQAMEVYVTVNWAGRPGDGPNISMSSWTMFTKNGLSDKQFIETY